MQYLKALALLILELSVILTVIMIGVFIFDPRPIGYGALTVSVPEHSKNEAKPPIVTPPQHPKVTREMVIEEIRSQAVAYGVNVDEALAIAKCESTFNPNASSKKSTAKGIYQFTDPTWRWIGAQGHQFDYQENIKQFMTHYPKNPQWWAECLP